MKKSILFFDIDQTCYNGFTLLDLAINQCKNGLISQNDLNIVLNDLNDYRNGVFSYEKAVENSLIHFLQIIKGKKRSDFFQNAKNFFVKNKNKFYPFLPQIVSKYKNTHESYFISSGFDYSIEAICQIFGLDGFICNQIETKNDIFQGKLTIKIYNQKDKEIEAKKILLDHLWKGSIGFGDSISDAGFMNICQKSVCINPSQELQKLAEEKKWMVCKPEEVII